MVRRSNLSLTIALCTSMTLHAALLSLLAWWYVTHTPPPRLEALIRPDAIPPIIVDSKEKPPPPPDDAPPDDISPPRKPPPPPPPADFSNATKAPLRDDSGETDGKGTANRSTPGDKSMQAAAGLEQANLSRDTKETIKSRLDDSPLSAQSGVPIGADAIAQAAPSFGVPEPSVVRQPMIAIADPMHTATAQNTVDKPQHHDAFGSPSGTRNVQSSPTLTPPAPVREVKGHSSIASDTDSFPFAKANSAHFHNGKMDARQGRRVKTTRIEFGLAASADFLSLGGPSVVLGATVDAAGNVQNVVILHSSGSDNIDLPSQSAVYNWWFEPRKDKDGQPLPDLWVVTID